MDILLFLIALITFIILFVYILSLENLRDIQQNMITIIFFTLLPISTSTGFLTLLNSDRLYSIEHDDDTAKVTISSDMKMVDGISTETIITKETQRCLITLTSYIPATSPLPNDSNNIFIDGFCRDVIDSPEYNSIIKKLKIQEE